MGSRNLLEMAYDFVETMLSLSDLWVWLRFNLSLCLKGVLTGKRCVVWTVLSFFKRELRLELRIIILWMMIG